MTTFTAIDYSADSACAVGLTLVKGRSVVCREQHLLRPPVWRFAFTPIHGLTEDDARDAPFFDELWPTLRNGSQTPVFWRPITHHSTGICSSPAAGRITGNSPRSHSCAP
jgi:hypothetical protein